MKNNLYKHIDHLSFFMDNRERKLYIFTIAIRVVFLIFVLFSFGDRGLVMMGDSPDYLVLAQKIVTTNSMISGGEGYEDIYETTRLPGFPLFLSVLVFFQIPFFIGSLVQILITSSIPIIIMRLGKYCGLDGKITFLTGILCAFEPSGIVYGTMLLPDAFNAWMFIVAFSYLVYFIKETNSKYLYASAVLFSIMNYIRPSGLFLGIILPVCLVLYSLFLEREKFKSYLKNAIVFGFIFFAILLPWMTRNYIHYRVFSFASGIERQIYEITAVGVRASFEKVSQAEMLQKMRGEILPKLIEKRDLANFRNNGILLSPALDIIISHPVQYLKLYVMSLVTFFASGNYHYIGSVFHLFDNSEISTSYTMIYATQGIIPMIKALFMSVMRPYGATIIFGRILWVLLAVFTIIGMFIERKNKEIRPITIFFLCICIYMVIVISHITVGIEARHRLFINPFYYLFTAISVHAMIALLKKSKYVKAISQQKDSSGTSGV
ncbi:MAG: hypothetical protein WAX44_01700 [Minisyncoccia bacterium]